MACITYSSCSCDFSSTSFYTIAYNLVLALSIGCSSSLPTHHEALPIQPHLFLPCDICSVIRNTNLQVLKLGKSIIFVLLGLCTTVALLSDSLGKAFLSRSYLLTALLGILTLAATTMRLLHIEKAQLQVEDLQSSWRNLEGKIPSCMRSFNTHRAIVRFPSKTSKVAL